MEQMHIQWSKCVSGPNHALAKLHLSNKADHCVVSMRAGAAQNVRGRLGIVLLVPVCCRPARRDPDAC